MYKIINSFGLTEAVMTKRQFMDYVIGIHDNAKSSISYWITLANKVWVNDAKEFTISAKMVNQIEKAINTAKVNHMNNRMVEAVSSRTFNFHKVKYNSYGKSWRYASSNPISRKIVVIG